MQGRVDVPEKDAATQALLSVTHLCSGKICLLRAGDAAANENQESARVNRPAAKHCDRRPLDHQVARQYAGSDRLEFQ